MFIMVTWRIINYLLSGHVVFKDISFKINNFTNTIYIREKTRELMIKVSFKYFKIYIM